MLRCGVTIANIGLYAVVMPSHRSPSTGKWRGASQQKKRRKHKDKQKKHKDKRSKQNGNVYTIGEYNMQTLFIQQTKIHW